MQLIDLSVNQQGFFLLAVSGWLIFILAIISIVVLIVRFALVRHLRTAFEINEAEIGIGSIKIKIHPTKEDLQMAYKLWVELKTRNLGILIDDDKDVIYEVYNSWYEFFKITRELIKSIPAQKVRGSDDTRTLVDLSIKILNEGLRPHLTTWQAKYRRWYDHEIKDAAHSQLPPQSIQRKYPEYTALITDMKRVNGILVKYAALLESMIHK